MINKMIRDDVYKAIDSERDFQDKLTADINRPDMIDTFHMGDSLGAIQYNLTKALETWYRDSEPYQSTLEYLRKIAGLVVKQGEQYGLPSR